jgi:3-isopropylmalate dehydratase small subunit
MTSASGHSFVCAKQTGNLFCTNKLKREMLPFFAKRENRKSVLQERKEKGT